MTAITIFMRYSSPRPPLPPDATQAIVDTLPGVLWSLLIKGRANWRYCDKYLKQQDFTAFSRPRCSPVTIAVDMIAQSLAGVTKN
jgi:hypothetical protein